MNGDRGDTGRITTREVVRIALIFGCVVALRISLGDSVLDRVILVAAVVVGVSFMSWSRRPRARA